MNGRHSRPRERREVVTTPARHRPELTDKQLVELVLAGAPGAVDLFVDRFTKFVHSVFHRDLKMKPEDADDLHNETFLRLLDDNCRRLRSWRGEGNLVNWLGPVCRNLANDNYNKKKTRKEISIDGGDDENDPAPIVPLCTDPSPEDMALAAEKCRLVDKALEALSERDRSVLHLRHFEEKSYREIAEITGYKISSVGVILARAEERLRKEVDRLLDKRRGNTEGEQPS